MQCARAGRSVRVCTHTIFQYGYNFLCLASELFVLNRAGATPRVSLGMREARVRSQNTRPSPRERVYRQGSVQEHPREVLCEFGQHRKLCILELVLDLKKCQKVSFLGAFSGRVGDLMESVHFGALLKVTSTSNHHQP